MSAGHVTEARKRKIRDSLFREPWKVPATSTPVSVRVRKRAQGQMEEGITCLMKALGFICM